MSIVAPLPFPMNHHSTPPLLPRAQALSPTRSSPSPTRLSRPSTPPNLKDLHGNALSSLQPISAPPTPVTPTHFFNLDPGSSRMERCRSSEAAIGVQTVSILDSAEGRDSRRRDVKATGLLFNTMPSKEQIHKAEKGESFHLEHPVEIGQPSVKEEQPVVEEDDKMDIDGEQPDLLSEGAVAEKMAHMQEEAPSVWGMPKWGWEEERMEVRKGVRLVGMEELVGLVEQHNMLDVPSQVLFPWLHGIADDGKKGRDMATFFGHAPPFEPPPYRGLCLLSAPPHPLDSRPSYPRLSVMQSKPSSEPSDMNQPEPQTPISPSRDKHEPRERSETMSTSSESYVSSNETDMTSPSISEFQPQTPDTPARPPHSMEPEVAVTEDDVQMHPCESMRPSPVSKPKGLDQERQLPPWETADAGKEEPSVAVLNSSDSSSDPDNTAPSCILANVLHAQDIFEFPAFQTQSDDYQSGIARFRCPRLPQHINLRNLNIQQIKYATISDIILYAKNGAAAGVLQIASMIADSQERLYQERLQEFYVHQKDRQPGEGMAEPVRYGVWVLLEPFHKVEKLAKHLINLDSKGTPTDHAVQTDLFERESVESRAMTKASEVVEGFWVGNEFDVPEPNLNPGSPSEYDVVIRASEHFEMPATSQLTRAYKQLADMDKKRESDDTQKHSWVASPATIALRNLLSPGNSGSPLPDTGSKRSSSPTDETTPTKLKSRRSQSAAISSPIVLQCSGSCRNFLGQVRNLSTMTDKVVELVYFLRKLVEGRDQSGLKKKILVYCQDGYTESSIIVLAYIMSSLSISLPEAYLHLQVNAKRSFFLYPSDKPLLRKVDARLAADRRSQALKLISSPSTSVPSSPTSISSPSSPLSSRWKAWGFGVKDTSASTSTSTTGTTMTTTTANAVVSASTDNTVEVARQMLAIEERGGSKESQDARVWFDDKRFDGLPSRILDFLYLGNLEHAGNAAMLHALGITHVVSVGESLISCPVDCDPMYGQIGTNTLSAEAAAGRIQVLDLADIRDDGNDPLRPLIARACGWIEEARQNGGTVLVHCRVGVSRSASIVMAYMMQHKGLGLMDAYLLTRARRLNVLIQPNLRFFHELFGWEVELAKAEMKMIQLKREEMGRNHSTDKAELEALKKAEEGKRKIYYSWPSFCRDLHCLNRRFLCN